MVKLSTHCVCPFAGLFPQCLGGGYELSGPLISGTSSVRYVLTTPLVLCVCDDWFWVVRYHLPAGRCHGFSLLSQPLHLQLRCISAQSLPLSSLDRFSMPCRGFGRGQCLALPMHRPCHVVRPLAGSRASSSRRCCRGSRSLFTSDPLSHKRDQIVWWLQKGGRVKDRMVAGPVHPRFRACIGKPSRPTPRPWSPAEIHVRTKAEGALKSARTWAALGLRVTAISFCLNGLAWTFGFSRPFAIRDQIEDLMRQIDPDERIREGFRNS